MLWINIMRAAREGRVLTYQAPFDTRPVRLYPAQSDRMFYTYQVFEDILRITPGANADPFTANEDHAERMNVL